MRGVEEHQRPSKGNARCTRYPANKNLTESTNIATNTAQSWQHQNIHDDVSTIPPHTQHNGTTHFPGWMEQHRLHTTTNPLLQPDTAHSCTWVLKLINWWTRVGVRVGGVWQRSKVTRKRVACTKATPKLWAIKPVLTHKWGIPTSQITPLLRSTILSLWSCFDVENYFKATSNSFSLHNAPLTNILSVHVWLLQTTPLQSP